MPEDSSPEATRGSIPDQLLTFQTITSLLEILQDPSLNTEREDHPFQISLRNSQQEQLRDHRFLNAFATLLVRDNETVAVTTKNPPTPDSPTMEIVVCSNDGRDRTTPFTVGRPSGLPSQSLDCKPTSLPTGVALITPRTAELEAPLLFQPEPSNIDPYNPIPFLKSNW
jgi:hypothetical protein